jgi:predicted TIM-barrel fold metal-dependent hydrolase
MARSGFMVMDSDMHVYDPPDLYVKYMNPKWGDRIPRGESRTGERHGRAEMRVGDGTSMRPRNDEFLRSEERVADRYTFAVRRGYDPISQLEAMDIEGIDVALLFATSPFHGNDTLEPEYAHDICRAWNTWIADFCKADPKRLKASAKITLHDVNLAVEETRRVVNELGVTGLSILPEPVNGRRIHDRYFDPLWAEIERVGSRSAFTRRKANSPQPRESDLDSRAILMEVSSVASWASR